MHKHGFLVHANPLNRLAHFSITFFKITAVNLCSSYSFKASRKLVRIHSTHFGATSTYTPVIVLNQIENRELMQSSHLKRFRNFPFCHRSISYRAYYDRAIGANLIQFIVFKILKPMRYARSRNSLHTRSTALMCNFRFVCI